MTPEQRRRAVLDSLTAERYGPSYWWADPARRDTDLVQAGRRRQMAADFEQAERDARAAG